MAYQASQIFYVVDPASENWHVVLHGKKETNNEHEQAIESYELESFTSTMINKHCDDIIDDVLATRKDHDKRIYIYIYIYMYDLL